MAFADHFSGHADDYAKFRPVYPEPLFDWLAGVAPATQSAWDCACGSGQASRALAARFDRVWATDASERQIAHATGPDNLAFACAEATHSGLPNASADLVTVAQALHWFDMPAFYDEAQRVLRPGGVLAVWMYGAARVEGIDGSIVAAYEHDTIGPYWPPERRWIDRGYADVQLPGARLRTPAFAMQARWPLENLLGYIESWSATRRCRAATGRDPMTDLRRRLTADWGNPARLRTVTWRFVVLTTRLVAPIS